MLAPNPQDSTHFRYSKSWKYTA